jgi:hypothetical protein
MAAEALGRLAANFSSSPLLVYNHPQTCVEALIRQRIITSSVFQLELDHNLSTWMVTE